MIRPLRVNAAEGFHGHSTGLFRLFTRSSSMRTYIYVDGFNLYYRAVKDTPYNWLDFKKVFEYLLDPSHQIISIKYFTTDHLFQIKKISP